MKLMIVEGKDEANFFTALLKHMSIIGVNIENSEGKDKFKENIMAILMSAKYADQVTVLGIVGDADNDAAAAFTKLNNIINGLGYKNVKRKNEFVSYNGISSGIYIMPGEFDTGMLEDLCLMTAKDKDKVALVERFIAEAHTLAHPPTNVAKSKAMAYLSIMPNYVPSVGLGALRGYWDFDCSEMDGLRTFVECFR